MLVGTITTAQKTLLCSAAAVVVAVVLFFSFFLFMLIWSKNRLERHKTKAGVETTGKKKNFNCLSKMVQIINLRKIISSLGERVLCDFRKKRFDKNVPV